MKIIVDAMGGDNAPQAVVEGAVAAAKEYGVDIVLVGKQELVESLLKKNGADALGDKISVVNASEVVDMEDDPTTVLRNKKDSSMSVALHLLKDGGIFLLHTITGHDEVVSEPWIRKYIFPGGTLPSLRELISHAYDADFRVLDVESLRRHYYRTLMCWYHNFLKVHETVAGWKNEEFVRMWDLYLAGCAAAFYIGYIDIHQVLMTKGNNNELPMTRWY